MPKGKIAVVGVGAVGATTAFTLAMSGLATELVLVDVNQPKAIGKPWTLPMLRLSSSPPGFTPEHLKTAGTHPLLFSPPGQLKSPEKPGWNCCKRITPS